MGKSGQRRLKQKQQALGIAWKSQREELRGCWGEVYPLSRAHPGHTPGPTPASSQAAPNPSELQHSEHNPYSPQKHFLLEQVRF